MRGIVEAPKGLVYQADFIDPQTEDQLLQYLKRLELESVTIRGNTAKRTVHHFGLRYDYASRTVRQGEPMPPELISLQKHAEKFAQLEPGSIVEALINKYPVGATIGWHHDAPVFEAIVGISLHAPCIMQFQRRDEEERYVYERIINPRSAYILRDEVRDIWEHHIPATKFERYSITFRSLK